MKIKEILDEIAALSGKIEKRETLAKYKDNELLKKVIYAAHSPRIKYNIKKIPSPHRITRDMMTLNEAIDSLDKLSSGEVRGNAAKEHLAWILGGLMLDDQTIIERIIGKNLKIGMDSGYNDVIPGLIEETPYQGAVSFSEKKARKLFENLGEDEYVMSQIKADGTYRNAETGNAVILTSRQGEVSYLKGAKLLEELGELEDFVLNGELTIDGKDRYEANGMVSSMMDIIEKEAERDDKTNAKKLAKFEKSHGSFEEALQKLRFTVWDVLSYEEFSQKKSDMEYGDRFGGLEDLLWSINPTMISVVETRYIKTYAEAIEHFLDAQARGLEGTIIKSASAGWKDGKPTYQIKMKLEMTMDLRVVKPVFGTEGKKYENFINGFELESDCGTIKTTARGVKEKEMKIFTEEGDNLIGAVMEVRCCGLSQNSDGEWSLLHPSIVEWRKDKNTCDDFNSCKEIEEMAKGLKDLVEK